MAKLLKWVKARISNVGYGQELEAFIMSKKPQSVADIEYWTSQFDKRAINRRWGL
jgi:hypothetical protein